MDKLQMKENNKEQKTKMNNTELHRAFRDTVFWGEISLHYAKRKRDIIK